MDEWVVFAFVFEFVARSTHTGAGRIAALRHEVGNDAMEGDVVVKALIGQEDKVIDGFGGSRWVELEDDLTLRGAQRRDVLFGDVYRHLGRGAPLFVIGHGRFLSYIFHLYYTQVTLDVPELRTLTCIWYSSGTNIVV